MRVFLCHSSTDANFVCQVASYLHTSFPGGVYYYEACQTATDSFMVTIEHELKECQVVVVFVGARVGPYQQHEVELLAQLAIPARENEKRIVSARLNGAMPGDSLPDGFGILTGRPQRSFTTENPEAACDCAQFILHAIGLPWKGKDGLPANPHLFDYEKNIIDLYADAAVGVSPGDDPCSESGSDARWRRDYILYGAPASWPLAVKWEQTLRALPGPPVLNRVPPDEIGNWRDDACRVVAAALSGYHMHCTPPAVTEGCRMLDGGLTFLEAGPREHLHYDPSRALNVAIIVSGGIAPGINAVIDGIVQRHWLYAEHHNGEAQLVIRGFRNGLLGFNALGGPGEVVYLAANSRHESVYRNNNLAPCVITIDRANEGGSILETSRADDLMLPEIRSDLLHELVSEIAHHHIDICYFIGGDGTMKAAHAVWHTAYQDFRAGLRSHPLSVVAVPKTMDNDILWVWQSFGFLSAVEKARETIAHLFTEVKSNPRLCVLQLFGSDSGFVVSHAILASSTGWCDAALIPEAPFSMTELACHVKKRMWGRRSNTPYGLVVMAETAIPVDALRVVKDYQIELTDKERKALNHYCQMRDQGQRFQGQTNDHLRSAGLKIVSQGLEKLIPQACCARIAGTPEPNWGRLRVFTNEPRHLLRAIAPSCNDIIIGQRLGILAVDNAMAGFTDFMISQWLTEYVLVPLPLVVLGRKRIPQTGIFWKSVLAKTGQPANLVGDSLERELAGTLA
ncbi:MAG TPA: 6-phosphofructokinase [Armatimonadota bacterium]|jgi:6-phosphofructokinase 1